MVSYRVPLPVARMGINALGTRGKRKKSSITKLPAKSSLGVPSLETVTRIDDNDKVAAFQAAHFRLAANMRELEVQFEHKASELRSAFVAEIETIATAAE